MTKQVGSELYVAWSWPVHFSDGAPTILAKLMCDLVSQENCQTNTLNLTMAISFHICQIHSSVTSNHWHKAYIVWH